MATRKRLHPSDFGLLLLAVIWGVNFSVMKYVLTELDPLVVNAFRFPLASLALWIAVRGVDGPAPARSDWIRIFLLGVVGNVAYQLCFIIGIDLTLAGNASLLLATTPVWTMLLGAAVGDEEPTAWVAVGIAGTVLGITLVVVGRGEPLSLSSATLRGDLLMILASLLWSAYTVAGRKPVERFGSLRTTAWTLWIATPPIVAFGVPGLLTLEPTRISAGVWVGVLFSGLFAIGLAYVLWYRGVESLGNNRTAVYSNMVPVAALITAWLWLGEVPRPLQLVGAGVILIGLTLARFGGPSTQSPGSSALRWRSSGNS